MLNRFATGAALLLVSLPLIACGGGNNDSTSSGTSTTSFWSGHTYLLSLKKGDWSVPRGVGADLFGVAPAFMFDVEGSGENLTTTLGYGPGTVTDASMNPVAVTADNVMQDPCGPTTTAMFSAANSPKSTINIPQMKMHVLNSGATPPLQVTADVFNLTFTDILPNGTTPSTTGSLVATMDFKQLYVLFASLGPTRDAASVCQALSDHYTPSTCTTDDCKVKCETCPNASASDTPTCLTVEADQIGAVEADNLKVSTITTVDPTACADSTLPSQ
ncbi:MAG TPA: hypothetical protein VMI54_30955 [Polyangiaceae bacterium]|nr:hypothetical protein [Polyangiaceae bacterium]